MQLVYTFTNTRTGAQFVGVTHNLKKTAREHYRMLRLGHHMSRRLQADWRTYGPSGWRFAIVEVLPRHSSRQDGSRAAARWAEKLRPVYRDIEPGAASDY
jgi:hypothetical protein